MYHLGLGTPRNRDLARGWFRQSAALGNAAAQRNLGALYGGVQQGHYKAYARLLLAEQLGNQRAAVALAAMSDKLSPNQIMRARTWATKRAMRLALRGMRHVSKPCVVRSR